MELSDLDFGTVPAVAGVVVAFLMLVLAYLTYRANLGRRRRERDVRAALESHARQLAVSPHRISDAGHPPGTSGPRRRRTTPGRSRSTRLSCTPAAASSRNRRSRSPTA